MEGGYNKKGNVGGDCKKLYEVEGGVESSHLNT